MTKLNFFKTLIIASVSVFVVSSCDKIEGTYVIHNAPVDTAACPVPDFPAVTVHFKRALLEDYTGHTCVNCPHAALISRDLKTQYKDSLVVLAVHAGYYAKPSSNPLWVYDFRTPAGTSWDDFFKVGLIGNPNGMVSRKGYPANQQVLSPSAWANAVKNTVAEAPLMDLQLITEYNPTEDKLCIHTKISFLETVSGRSLDLSVIITEDSIVQAQKNNDPLVGATPEILDYVHMHVMRGAVNSTWGTPLLLKEETSSTPLFKTFQTHFTNFNINTMIPKNCRVVAFVYDVDTKEILQVAERDVME